MTVTPANDRGYLLAAARQQYVDQQQFKALATGKAGAPPPVLVPPDGELIASNPQLGEELAALTTQSTPVVPGSPASVSDGRGAIVNVIG